MNDLPPKDHAVVAMIFLFCAVVIVCLVELDRNHHAWMALLVYAGVYAAIAIVERRSKG